MVTVSTVVVESVFVWPIKGCRPVQPSRACITRTGFRFDREWSVVKADNGKFISQREQPTLALVQPSLPLELVAQPASEKDAVAALNVDAPGMPTLTVPLVQAPVLRTVTVWEWTGSAADCGDAAAEWFTKFLGTPCRLVRYLGALPPTTPALATPADAVRPVDPEFAQGSETSLNDGYPFLLASQDSLDDLNKRLAASGSQEAGIAPVSIKRFRPNILIKGLQPWAEDKYRSLVVSSPSGEHEPVELTSVKPCSRCKVPTVDPETGIASQGEPIDTLATFRKGTHLDWSVKSWKHAIHFGWNLVHNPEMVGRVICVGDTVQLSGAQTAW